MIEDNRAKKTEANAELADQVDERLQGLVEEIGRIEQENLDQFQRFIDGVYDDIVDATEEEVDVTSDDWYTPTDSEMTVTEFGGPV